jgi:hypothetical protein
MTTDFRAELERLVKAYDDHGGRWPDDDVRALYQAVKKARAALSAPEQGPTDEALASFTAYFCRNYPGPDTIIHKPEWHAPKIFRAAADAIARWGRPAVEPVPEEGEWW